MRLTRFGRAILVQALLGILAVAVLLWRIDLLDALRGLPSLDLRWALAGLALFTASKLLHAMRWRLLLRHRPEVPTRDLLALFLVGNFVNAVMPLRIGDLIRIELPRRRYGVPRAELASNVVVVESLFDGVAYVLMLLGALALIDIPALLRPALLAAAAGILAAFVLAAGAARTRPPRDPSTYRLLRRLPAERRAAIVRRLGDLVQGMASLRSARVAGMGLAISVAGWGLEVTASWVLARALGVPLTYPQTLLVTVAANIAVALPLTPWNVGPYELAVTELLVLLGVARGDGAQFAVGSHLLLMAWIALTGVAAMGGLRLRFSDLRGQVELLPRPVADTRAAGARSNAQERERTSRDG